MGTNLHSFAMRSKSFLASMSAYVASCFCIAADQYGDHEDQAGDGPDEDESPLAAESDATATHYDDACHLMRFARRRAGVAVDGNFNWRRTRCTEAISRRSIDA